MDALYRFILIDVGKCFHWFYVQFKTSILCIHVYVGDAGRHSDGVILGNCAFGQALEDGDLNIPEDLPLPGS